MEKEGPAVLGERNAANEEPSLNGAPVTKSKPKLNDGGGSGGRTRQPLNSVLEELTYADKWLSGKGSGDYSAEDPPQVNFEFAYGDHIVRDSIEVQKARSFRHADAPRDDGQVAGKEDPGKTHEGKVILDLKQRREQNGQASEIADL